MTNIFASNRDPRVAARNLDDKRLANQASESYFALCGALLLLRQGYSNEKGHDLPYSMPGFYRRHPLIAWLAAEREHARWTLKHAEALVIEHRRRYGGEGTAPYHRAHAYLVEHLKEIPTQRPKRIEFYLASNFDQFRRENSEVRPGFPALPDHVPVTIRYRLVLLHKWLYLDKRPTVWTGCEPPAWAFNPRYRFWLMRHFGLPNLRSPQLYMPRPRTVTPNPHAIWNMEVELNALINSTPFTLTRTDEGNFEANDTRAEYCFLGAKAGKPSQAPRLHFVNTPERFERCLQRPGGSINLALWSQNPEARPLVGGTNRTVTWLLIQRLSRMFPDLEVSFDNLAQAREWDLRMKSERVREVLKTLELFRVNARWK